MLLNFKWSGFKSPLYFFLAEAFMTWHHQVGRRTSDKGNVRRSFLWLDGPSVGEGHCRTAGGGRLEVFTSF